MSYKLIKQIKGYNLIKDPFIIEIIPNDGLIFENISQAVIAFDEKEFMIYIYKGFFKQVLTDQNKTFKFDDIIDIEFGKYSFKHPYVKISFSEEEYIVFSYFYKKRNYEEQTKNIKKFFMKLEKIEKELSNE